MIARRIIKVIIVCLIGTFAVGAQAQEEKWKTVVHAPYRGYVVSYDRPISWREDNGRISSMTIRFSKDGRQVSQEYRSVTSLLFNPVKTKRYFKRLGYKGPNGSIHFIIKQIVFPRPMTLERWVEIIKSDKWSGHYQGNIVYEEGTTQVLGKKAFYYVWSEKTKRENGKDVPETERALKEYLVFVNDRVLLDITLYPAKKRLFKVLQPIFDRILKSLKVTPVAKLDASRLPHALSTPKLHLSVRFNYYLIIHPSLIVPPGWSAALPIVRRASAAKPRGRVIVEILRRKDPGGPSILLVIEGMPLDGPLENNNYFATADRLIGKLMAQHGPGKTVKFTAPGWSFCIPVIKTRYWRGTGHKVRVRIYSGKDAKGRKVGALVYTMGGLTAACNLIFIAQTKDFDKALKKARPDIEAIFKSIELHTLTSAFQ